MSSSYNFEPKAAITSSKQEIQIRYNIQQGGEEDFLEKLLSNPLKAIGDAAVDFVKKNVLGDSTGFPAGTISIGEITSFKVVEKSTSRIVKPAFYDTPTTVFDFEGYDIEFSMDKTSYYANFLMHLQIASMIKEANDAKLDSGKAFVQPEFLIVDSIHYQPSPGQRLRKMGSVQRPGQILQGIIKAKDSLFDDVLETYTYQSVVFYGYEKSVESEDKPITETVKAFSPIRTCNVEELVNVSFPDESKAFMQAIKDATAGAAVNRYITPDNLGSLDI